MNINNNKVENSEEHIDFKTIPTSLKLVIARRKIISLVGQVEVQKSINNDLHAKIWELEANNRELLISNMDLHKKTNAIEEKIHALNLPDRLSKKDRNNFKKTEFYKEMGLLLKSKAEKIKKLEKNNDELIEIIIKNKSTQKS